MLASLVFLASSLLVCDSLHAQFNFDDAPILYQSSEANDRVAKLARQLESDEVELAWDESTGWLSDLLSQLQVPTESQTLVFSKTSLQNTRIHPGNPRAIYFNDDVYIGYIPGANNIEMSAVDPDLGAVFYTINQVEQDKPTIKRDQHECMTCHGTGNTKDVPGFLVRSVFPLISGHPKYSLGTVTTSHGTRLFNRFGGWYVTGQHGEMRHRGNAFLEDNFDESLDREAGANQASLPKSVRTEQYASTGSDIVALMLLDHQTQMHNLITAANYEARRAADYDERMNKLFDRPANHVSKTTQRRIKSAGDQLLKYMLFADEAELDSAVSGDPEFAKRFESAGPKDSRGRSLRQLDLGQVDSGSGESNQRMFRYPCSFLIYSESYASLPKPMLDYVETRLVAILSGEDSDESYSSLSSDDRQAILEILSATIPRIGDRLERLQSADQ